MGLLGFGSWKMLEDGGQPHAGGKTWVSQFAEVAVRRLWLMSWSVPAGAEVSYGLIAALIVSTRRLKKQDGK